MNLAHPTPLDYSGVYEKLRRTTEQDKHICFVFGAGASFGYSRIAGQLAPPVVANLFDDSNPLVASVLSKHSEVLRRRGAIADELIEHGGDLEAYLGKLYERNPASELFTQLVLYIEDICAAASETIDAEQSSNNYLRLIYRMEGLSKPNRWSCVTFNYDTILERSFIAAGSQQRKFSHLSEYNFDPKILKIHGGVNLRFRSYGRENEERAKSRMFRLMMDYHSENGVKGDKKRDVIQSISLFDPIPHFKTPERLVIGPSPMERVSIFSFPVMMVPIHNTNITHNDYFSSALKSSLKELDRAKLVVAIGYNFGDKLFVEGLKNLKTREKDILIVSGPDFSGSPGDCPAYNQLAPFWEGSLYMFRGAKFSGFVDAIYPPSRSAAGVVGGS